MRIVSRTVDTLKSVIGYALLVIFVPVFVLSVASMSISGYIVGVADDLIGRRNS
jgi:hypothetical protein